MENDSGENVSDTSSNTIQAIDKKTVHQICSGQVVLDLATAVKELVENSVDARATNIEIRLQEFGKESLEVSDNGDGIKETDFEALALKHYTSKLREFNDLPSVCTFGFRGEALSSLAALGNLTVTTHHSTAEVGSKLTFNHDGKLIDRSFAARELGTSVLITNLFYTLPVRYKEFHRNFKKDFGRLMNVLYAFCLVNPSVRFSCINQVGKKKNMLFSTSGKNNTLSIISSIFGTDQMKNVIKIEQTEPIETIIEEYNLSKSVYTEYANLFQLEGHVSSVTHGCGRSTADRQFIFINKRPCDFPKLTRVINDIYHMFNRQQYPFVFLNISLNKDYVDVNVTPDKRQIMIHQENVLLVVVKSSLKHMFENNSTYYVESKLKNNFEFHSSSPNNSFRSTDPPSKSSVYNADGQRLCADLLTPCSKSKNSAVKSSQQTSLLDKFRSKYEKPNLIEDTSSMRKQTPDKTNIESFFSKDANKRKHELTNDPFDDTPTAKKSIFPTTAAPFCENSGSLSFAPLKEVNSTMNISEKTIPDSDGRCLDNENVCLENFLSHENEVNGNKSSVEANDEQYFCDEVSNVKTLNLEFDNEKRDKADDKKYFWEKGSKQDTIKVDFESNGNTSEHDEVIIMDDDIGIEGRDRERVVSFFDLEKLKRDFTFVSNMPSNKNLKVSFFRAKIATSDNHSAEEELGKNVKKEMFLEMDILGQFNLGFIITKLNEDLFIIDQHASDEKYNYETLQQKHCLKGQRLIQPLPLKLTSVDETILLNNLEIFNKNGFEFDIKEECDNPDEGMIRINLLTIPTSRNWTFSTDDVEELIYLLGDSPGVMCRPSRVHKMFASRACRTSVMVGTALNKQKMKTLVEHMSEIDQPWNCPHGRPTMRHLINLQRIQCSG